MPPIDLYLDYFALLSDNRRLNSLSWEEKKIMAEREWTAWTPFLQKQGGIEAWLSLKSESLQNQGKEHYGLQGFAMHETKKQGLIGVLDRLDLEVDLLLQKNIIWLSKVVDNKGLVPSSSVIIDYLMNQYSEQKVNQHERVNTDWYNCITGSQHAHDVWYIWKTLQKDGGNRTRLDRNSQDTGSSGSASSSPPSRVDWSHCTFAFHGPDCLESHAVNANLHGMVQGKTAGTAWLGVPVPNFLSPRQHSSTQARLSSKANASWIYGSSIWKPWYPMKPRLFFR